MPVCWTGSCEETAVVSFVSKDAITSAASMSEMSATSTPTVPPSSGVRGLSKDTSAFGSLPERLHLCQRSLGCFFPASWTLTLTGGSRERSNTLGDLGLQQGCCLHSCISLATAQRPVKLMGSDSSRVCFDDTTKSQLDLAMESWPNEFLADTGQLDAQPFPPPAA